MNAVQNKRIALCRRPAIRTALLIIVCSVVFLGWNHVAKLQTNETSAKTEKKERPVTVTAEKRGYPNISLANGTDLVVDGEQNNGSPGKLLASADVDSDGTADLIVADEGGNLRVFHGVPEAKRSLIRKAQGLESPEPFSVTGVSIPLGISPDFLETGDFNADGHPDILAAAKGSNALILVAGFGNGSFAEPTAIALDGRITAFAVGAIGLRDGQMDLAVAVTNKNGSHLLVFEHPESAFKYKPEVIDLPSPADTIAIGDLNGDHYSDIAVGGGTTLTIVSERGQAYPWDTLKDSGIKRPSAIVEKRQMPQPIASLVIGTFGGERENSLAVLFGSGAVMRLKPTPPVIEKRPSSLRNNESRMVPKFLPVDVTPKEANTISDQIAGLSADDPTGSILVDSRASAAEKQAAIDKKYLDDAKQDAKLTPADRERKRAEILGSAAQKNGRARAAFLRNISARPSNVAKWGIETLVNDSRLSSAASGPGERMIRGRVSLSGTDDLIFPASTGNQLNIVAFPKNESGLRQAEVISLDADTAPQAVLPMRVNGDAMDDLVVLRAGSGVPTFVPTTPASTIIVNTTDDIGTPCDSVGQCSLRSAIQLANTQPGSFIAVLIPSPGVHTFTPLSQLPVVRANGTYLAAGIDGTTGAKLHEITGGQAGVADGIKIRASNCTVQDFVINNFQGYVDPNTGSVTGSNSITVESTQLSPNSSNNVIIGNYLGTDATGTIAKDGGTGVLVFDSDSNVIVANLMSGLRSGGNFGNGIGLDITAGNNTLIFGNFIGTTANGNVRLQNGSGVWLSGANNQFGDDAPGYGNVVSGNGRDRQPGVPDYPGCDGQGMSVVLLLDPNTGEYLTANNTVKGNKIGTSSDGTQPLGNCSTGLTTSAQTKTTIGSITQTGRNIISGNGLDAIYCGYGGSQYSEGGYCAIAGNNIGTDITGTVSIPNTLDNVHSGLGFITGSVLIVNSDTYSYFGSPGGTTPGGDCTGFCNLLSGQYTTTHFAQGDAFLRFGWGTVGAFNNYVGTDRTGTQALPNMIGFGMGGATYDPSTSFIGGYGSDGNGGDVSFGNLISGNVGSGIVCGAYVYGIANCNVYNNLIGTDVTGSNALPNAVYAESAVVVTNGFGTMNIGGPVPLARNIISGNHNSGLGMRNYGGNLTVSNNFIGVNKAGAPLGNEASGIFGYYGPATIGGSSADANNIASNSGPGVLLSNSYGSPSYVPSGVSISQNHIRDNGGLGIDITPTAAADGVTANDCVDHDAGPNEIQNFPVMIAPVFNGDGTVTLTGTLNSEIAKPYRIDFYSNTTLDPSNYGEGDNYIGSTNVTTNGNGFVSFTTTTAGQVAPGSFITATATNLQGSTSEFSCAAGLCTGNGATLADLRELDVMCAEPITVTVTGDEPDADTADGVCDVDTNLPELQCTLRAAIQEANARFTSGQGNQDIIFNIPGSGVKTISPSSVLPDITSQVSINGTTQSGYGSTPVIEIDGENTPIRSIGLKVAGNGSAEIRGLAINRFPAGTGIWLEGHGGSKVKACFIGTNPAGTAQSGTMLTGIVISDSPGNFIGVGPSETAAYGRNLISGSFYANVDIQGSQSQNNNVAGNFFDLAANGQTPLPNPDGFGILVEEGAQNNMIGNVVTDIDHAQFLGSESVGILLGNGADGNTVVGNLITGTTVGIAVVRSANNIIGIEEAKRNTVGSSHVGIYIGNINPPIGTSPRPGREANVRATERQKALSKYTGDPLETGISRRAENPQSSATGNKVQGNWVGMLAGGEAIPNDYGIAIRQASGNMIGGETSPQHNIVVFSPIYGILLDAGADSNTLKQNFIGIGFGGNAAPNGKGVGIVGSNNEVIHNFISGNTSDGVRIFANPGDPEPDGNSVSKLNLIGVRADGRAPLPNGGYGVVIEAGTGNKIGVGRKGNLISGNGVANGSVPTAGIAIGDGVTGNTVSGNEIGTDIFGTSAIPNLGPGILIMGSQNYIVNNTVSGNGQAGIEIAKVPGNNSTPENNIVQTNQIGTNVLGTAAIPNTGPGIAIVNGANLNIIGGLVDNNGDPAIYSNGINKLGNLISGNYVGITISPGSVAGATSPYQNRIQGNLIGTDISGSLAIPNTSGDGGGTGIWIMNSPQNLIGGYGNDIPVARNVISGNWKSGIDINGADSYENRVSGNYIGTQVDGVSALGNRLGGVVFRSGAHNNMVGGTEANAGNTIAFNHAGVVIFPNAGCCNSVDPNTMYSNELLAINQGCSTSPPDDAEVNNLNDCSSSPFPNDADDADVTEGGNTLQNYPEITGQGIDGSGDLIVSYVVDSLPGNSNYGVDGQPGLRVELFKADARGQGQVFLGADQYTVADYGSFAARRKGTRRPASPSTAGVKTVNLGNAAALGFGPGDRVTATATDADGNTSEFFPPFAPTAAGVTVSGRVAFADGRPVDKVLLTLSNARGETKTALTNAFGYYRFDDVEAGNSYVLTVSSKRVRFTNPTRLLTISDTLADVEFVADG